jgi:hypothetical protein
MIESVEFVLGQSIYPCLLELQEEKQVRETLLSTVPEFSQV